MPRRDVDLVIKARDQAASVVDSVTKALNTFIDAQKNLDNRAEKTETTLTQLGASIGKLDQALKGLNAGQKLADDVDKAGRALDRLEKETADTQKQIKQLEGSLRGATDAQERYTGKLERNLAAQARQKAVIAQAKKDQTTLTKSYEQAVTAQEKLQQRQARLPELLRKAASTSDAAAEKFRKLSQRIAETAEPTEKLQQQLQRAEQRMIDTASKTERLKREFREMDGSLSEAAASITRFAQQGEQAAQNLARQETILKKMGESYELIKGQASAAGQAQQKFSNDLDRARSTLTKYANELERGRDALARQAQDSDRARQALEQLTNRGFLALVRAARDQKRVLLETSEAYARARDESTRLGQAVAQATAPTKAMVQAFEQAAATTTRLKAELAAQRQAFAEMGQTLQKTSRDYDGLKTSQASFLQILDRLEAELNLAANSSRRTSESVRQLSTSAATGAANVERLARATDRLGRTNQRAASETGRLADAYRRFYGDSRRSLSLLQRIRGEVLSLVAAYGGLYGAIRSLQLTVEATQKLEAAQARLNVAFNNDTERVAAEFDFLRRTSDRLGVSLGDLAQEYSKFNIATQNTSLEGAAARKIFLQIAEAARVNRSSTKELSGVFVALTQIVSKGAVQMEELRQQLGDRLPGAVKIMADGLGVGTAELIKMMEQGQVTEEALISFADEVERRFGGGLDAALLGVTVALGRLQNAAFQAAAQFGEGGFIEALTRFSNTLTEVLQSADFEAFSRRVSSALGSLIDLLGFLAQNFQVVITGIVSLLSFRLAPIVVALASNFQALARQATMTTTSFTALQTRAAAMGVTITRTGLAVRNLTRFMRGLLSTTGVGLAFVAVTTAITAWSTEADSATEALNEHRKIVDQVKNAYEAVGGAVDQWQKKLEDLTVSELDANLARIKQALEDTRSDLDLLSQGNDSFLTNFFGFNLSAGQEIFQVSRRYKSEVQGVIKTFRDGGLSGAEFIARLDDVNQKFNDGTEENRQFASALIEAARAEVEVVEALEEGNAALAARTGSLEEAAGAAETFGLVLDDGKDASKEFASAFEDLKKYASDIAKDVPKATRATDEAAEQAVALAEAYERALTAARALPDTIQRVAAEQQVLNEYGGAFANLMASMASGLDGQFGNFTDGVEAAASLIREREGFSASPYFDVNAYRAGFGSDTITLADGSVRAVTQGISVSVADANRDLLRRITTEFIPAIQKAVGEDRFNALTPAQQAALVSLTYNYGAGELRAGGDLSRVVAAVREGSKEGVAQAIAARAGDNGGINRGRRLQEAALFQSNIGVDALTEDAQRRAEEQAQFRQDLEDSLETMRQEAAVAAETLIIQEQQKAVREAELDARKAGVVLSEQDKAEIREAVAAKFAQKQAEEDLKNARERAVDAEQRVNALLAQRKALQDQLNIATRQGSTEEQDALRQRIEDVNTELEKAIQNAKDMWAAVGGADADTAIIKLETAAMKADDLNEAAQRNYLDWSRVGDLFVRGLASAFDRFSQAVAEGKSIGEAARDAFLQFASDFLREIAQMIIQQAIFNALKGAFGGTSFGNLIGIPAGHTGGYVGSSRIGSGNPTRSINPAIFAGALRYHTGGIAGLRPGEMPAILKQGEEVLTRDDPRHMLNGGGSPSSGGSQGITLINAVDGSDAMEQALSQSAGQDVFFNFLRSKRTEIKSILG